MPIHDQGYRRYGGKKAGGADKSDRMDEAA